MMDLQHNVGNLLYMIRGLVEVHLGRYDENRFEDQREALSHAHYSLKKIYDHAHRAIMITKRISQVMQTSPNGAKKKTDAVSILSVWEEVLKRLKEKHNLKETEMIVHIPKEFPRVLCEEQDLLEILYCLAENAVQAMGVSARGGKPAFAKVSSCTSAPAPACPAGRGKLIIRATLGFRTDEKPVANITIADTGPGISEERMLHLFEPFMTSRPENVGNGLGLCLVKGLIRKNDGTIHASSFKDCGTTFTLSFAVAKTQQLEQSNSCVLAGA